MVQELNNSAVEEAKTLFTEEGLSFPYIPEEMIASVQKLKPWIFGTRLDAPSPYQIAKFVQEIETKSVENYLIFGHAGYGTNSWAMHYYLVENSLALFIQTAWGGIYTENETAIPNIAYRFTEAEKLIKIVEAKEKQGKIASSQRLIVVVSDFYNSGWKFKDNLQKNENNWHDTFKALEEAISCSESL